MKKTNLDDLTYARLLNRPNPKDKWLTLILVLVAFISAFVLAVGGILVNRDKEVSAMARDKSIQTYIMEHNCSIVTIGSSVSSVSRLTTELYELKLQEVTYHCKGK